VICFGGHKLEENLSDLIPRVVELGVRCFDTAQFNYNIDFLSEGLKRTGLNREEFKIIYRVCNYKLPPKLHLDEVLKKTGLEYFDYLLIQRKDKNENWAKIYDGIKDYKHRKIVGVSNFGISDLKEFKSLYLSYPFVNQIESHFYFPQTDILNFCIENGIKIFSNSVFGRGKVLRDSRILKIAAEYNTTPSSLILGYYNKIGLNPIFSSSNIEHINDALVPNFNGNLNVKDIIELESLVQPQDDGRVTKECLTE